MGGECCALGDISHRQQRSTGRIHHPHRHDRTTAKAEIQESIATHALETTDLVVSNCCLEGAQSWLPVARISRLLIQVAIK